MPTHVIKTFEQFVAEESAATPIGVPGMGNVTFPGYNGGEGSGDASTGAYTCPECGHRCFPPEDVCGCERDDADNNKE